MHEESFILGRQQELTAAPVLASLLSEGHHFTDVRRPDQGQGRSPDFVSTLGEGVDALPVVDAGGIYVGVVTSSGLEGSIRSDGLESTAASLAQGVTPVRADETLEQAIERLVIQGGTGVPVVDVGGGLVIGWLTHLDVLAAYSARVSGKRPPPGVPDAWERHGV